ncbi:hypothetical protein CBOM_07886 [Ceraceosorus bombacis]|uniref:Uncharacterized protein n=1 Tax=Ceraceosorus bombacis TaxID=401625 RepID=A0A0P1BIK5_9BASI|nr:hypothetical protein CBOM_07886 [Ceraceosorus bombacis]
MRCKAQQPSVNELPLQGRPRARMRFARLGCSSLCTAYATMWIWAPFSIATPVKRAGIQRKSTRTRFIMFGADAPSRRSAADACKVLVCSTPPAQRYATPRLRKVPERNVPPYRVRGGWRGGS